MILNYYNDLIFQPSEIFLNKDFGQVATVLGTLHKRRVKHLICCNKRNESLQEFSGSEVTQTKKTFRFLPQKLDFLKNFWAYWYIFRNRNLFRVLVIFPFCPPSDLLIARLFLAFNPRAKVILKLDANLNHLEALQKSYEKAPRSRLKQHHYYRKLLEIADCVIYETIDVGRRLTQTSFLGQSPSEKFVNVFNGISDRQVRSIVDSIPEIEERENIIVFSGRLSSPEKNVELIFLADPVPAGWKIKFIGPVDESFKKIINRHRAVDLNFDKKYEFVGEIVDKEIYFREFSSGRILLLCSVKEGFPMVFAEAHYFGLYIVTTDVSGSAEATNNGQLGTVIPRNNQSALRDALKLACSNEGLAEATKVSQLYGSRKFLWEESLNVPMINKIFLETDD